MIFVFFFNQKTAYEMRISDWSSDVCSSDLSRTIPPAGSCPRPMISTGPPTPFPACRPRRCADASGCRKSVAQQLVDSGLGARLGVDALDDDGAIKRRPRRPVGQRIARSAEHTSELQSLMRITIVAICLTKKRLRK